VGAIREAEAFALEVAVSRALGEMAGLNVSRFPDRPEIRAFIDSWVVGIQENVEDFSEPHDRGLLFLWLAVLKDAQLEPVRRDLLNNHILSPDSLFGVHNRLVSLPPQIMDSYVEGLLDGVGDNQNIIIGELTRRLDSSVPTEGFIKYDLTPVLVP
jgi:hypothetical protein